MPDGFPIQTNFTSGELSPLIRGRVDLNRYFNGASKLRNFIVRPQGGIVRRTGTVFDYAAKYASELSIAVKFSFSQTTTFTLLFGRGYIWFFDSNGGVILSAGNPYEVATPYLEADLRDLYFTQSADVIYITHPNYPPKTLSRISNTNWVLTDYVTKDGPYLDEDTRGYTLWLSQIAPLATITSTVNEFVIGDIGKYVEFVYQGIICLGQITGYTNGQLVTISPIIDSVIDVTGFDNRTVLSFAAGGSTPARISVQATGSYDSTVVLAGGGSASYAAPTLHVSGTGSHFGIPSGWLYVPPSGGSAWPDRIRSVIAIWTEQHCNKYIRVDGVWYQLGTHLLAPESVNVTPGGNVSMDCMTVVNTPTMKITTGVLTINNYVIGAHMMCSNSLFQASDTNRLFRLNFAGEQVWGSIFSVVGGVVDGVSYGSDQHCLVLLYRMMPPAPNKSQIYLNDARTLQWRLGAWYQGNYPTCSVFHEERLWFAATTLQPQTIWSSKSSDFSNFAPTDKSSIVTDSNAVTETIASGEINHIKWMHSSTVLLIGTIGGEWQSKANTVNQPITPTNFAVTEQTSYGTAVYGRPSKVGRQILFPQSAGNKIRELTYNWQVDGYEAKDLTIISENILRDRGGVIMSAYQKEPTSVHWMVCANGDLVGMTYEKDQEVIAWHPHTLGGAFGTGTPQVLSVCSLPLPDGTNRIFMTVKRTINGATKVYLEHMDIEFAPSNAQDRSKMNYVDCGLSYSGAPVASVSGLGHLEGQTVKIMADGTLRTSQVVTAGVVAISGATASKVYVGLANTCVMSTMPIESGSPSGTAQGKIKRPQRVTIRMLNSLSFKVGPSESKNRQILFKTPGGNTTTDLFTGDKQHDLDSDYDLEGSFTILQDQPYALSILALMPQEQTNT